MDCSIVFNEKNIEMKFFTKTESIQKSKMCWQCQEYVNFDDIQNKILCHLTRTFEGVACQSFNPNVQTGQLSFGLILFPKYSKNDFRFFIRRRRSN